MLNLLKLIHVFLGLNALGAGASVCTRMVTGRSFDMWVKHFLRFSLAAASVGLILSIHHTGVIQLLTMLTVYACGFAVLSFRKYSVSEGWGPAVVLSTMCVLKALTACNALGRVARPDVLLAVFMVTAVLLFALLSMTALRKIYQHTTDLLMDKVAR
jgi:hypothetical protein